MVSIDGALLTEPGLSATLDDGDGRRYCPLVLAGMDGAGKVQVTTWFKLRHGLHIGRCAAQRLAVLRGRSLACSMRPTMCLYWGVSSPHAASYGWGCSRMMWVGVLADTRAARD